MPNVWLKLNFPHEIASTSLVFWSESPREDAVDKAHEQKRIRYADLEAVAEIWNLKVCPVKVGCRGFVANGAVIGYGYKVRDTSWTNNSTL